MTMTLSMQIKKIMASPVENYPEDGCAQEMPSEAEKSGQPSQDVACW